jgi:Ankyrin repeats (3 copies)
VGRFRLVVCQFDELRRCRSPAAVEKALRHLPKTLYETYDRILAAIDEDDRRDALSLLQWLAFSVDTLSLEEAVDVIATNPDAKPGPLFDRRRRLQDPRDILSICSCLVTITVPDVRLPDGEGTNDHAETGRVRLAHFSVREYLTSEHLGNSDAQVSYYHFSQRNAHRFIAKTCLAYLLQFDQDNGVNLTTFRSYPLSRYAANHWMTHARSVPAGDADDLHGLAMALLQPMSTVYKNWLWLYHQYVLWDPPEVPPLYYAAGAGLEQACQELLKMGVDVNALGGCFGTPLQMAAVHGHSNIVELLLEKGADFKAQGGVYGNGISSPELKLVCC